MSTSDLNYESRVLLIFLALKQPAFVFLAFGELLNLQLYVSCSYWNYCITNCVLNCLIFEQYHDTHDFVSVHQHIGFDPLLFVCNAQSFSFRTLTRTTEARSFWSLIAKQ